MMICENQSDLISVRMSKDWATINLGVVGVFFAYFSVKRNVIKSQLWVYLFFSKVFQMKGNVTKVTLNFFSLKNWMTSGFQISGCPIARAVLKIGRASQFRNQLARGTTSFWLEHHQYRSVNTVFSIYSEIREWTPNSLYLCSPQVLSTVNSTSFKLSAVGMIKVHATRCPGSPAQL